MNRNLYCLLSKIHIKIHFNRTGINLNGLSSQNITHPPTQKPSGPEVQVIKEEEDEEEGKTWFSLAIIYIMFL